MVADQHVAILEHYGAARGWIGNAAGAGIRVIAPNDVSRRIDVKNAVIAAVGDERGSIRQSAGKSSCVNCQEYVKTVSLLVVELRNLFAQFPAKNLA